MFPAPSQKKVYSAKLGIYHSTLRNEAITQHGELEQEQIYSVIQALTAVSCETTSGLAVEHTLKPGHRNADLPSSQQWHPSERRPLLPSTALFQGIHL